MSFVNLSSVDLNLLVVLDTVLETSSATQAAKRLHVTQSAISNALRRLRELFGDPLLVRTARGLAPTPRAVALAPHLRQWLAGAQALLGAVPFDPGTTTRRFTVAGTDALAATLLPPLVAAFRFRFPEASFRFVTLDRLIQLDGLGSGDVDLHIGIPPFISRYWRSEFLYEERFVTIASKRLRIQRMNLETFTSLPHYENALLGEADDDIDQLLTVLGRTRTVRAAVPHLSLLPHLVAAGDGIATVSRSLAIASGVNEQLDHFEPPVTMPRLRLVQVWHERSDTDPGVGALRSLVREVVASRPREGVRRAPSRASRRRPG